MHQDYSYASESKMEILHAYSSRNKELIQKSNKCYCFYCKNEINPSEITNYLKEDIKNDKGQSCMKESFVRVFKLGQTDYSYTAYVYCGDEKGRKNRAKNYCYRKP